MSTTTPYSTPQSQSGVGLEVDYQPKVFGFSGRIGRVRYLAYGAAWAAIFYALIAISGGLFSAGLSGASSTISAIGIGLLIISFIGLIVGSWVVMVRRLNDLDKSGWMSLLMFVPLANIWLAVIILFAAGTPGRNSYGPPPCANTTGVIVGACAIPGIMIIIGILAAIALPAYQDYTVRASSGLTDDYSPASQAMLYVGDVQEKVVDYVVENEAFPEQNSDIGLSWRSESQYIDSIDVSSGGKITVVLTASDADYDQRTMEFVPYIEDGYVNWDCSGGTLDYEFRPAGCTP